MVTQTLTLTKQIKKFSLKLTNEIRKKKTMENENSMQLFVYHFITFAYIIQIS